MADWTSTTLGELAALRIGRTPPRAEPKWWTTDAKERPWCAISDLTGKWVDPTKEGVTEAAEREGKAKRVPAGALLLSFKLSIGRVGFARRDVFTNEAIAWIDIHDEEVVTREYLRYWLGFQDLTATAADAIKGQTLNSSTLKEVPVEVPPLAEQTRLVDLLDALEREQDAAAQHLAALATLRTELLADLFAGTVLIPDDYDAFLRP